jgi:hypothetical protein
VVLSHEVAHGVFAGTIGARNTDNPKLFR